MIIYDNKPKWGKRLPVEVTRGHGDLTGVTCVLSTTLVDIISIIRLTLPLLAVSHLCYLGYSQLVGDSVNAVSCRGGNIETMLGT